MPLGLLENVSYREAAVQLGPGDVLVLYTDGVTDSENAQGDAFGAARLLDWASHQWQRSAEDVKKSLLDDVMGFSNGHRQEDDLTMLIIRFLGVAPDGPGGCEKKL